VLGDPQRGGAASRRRTPGDLVETDSAGESRARRRAGPLDGSGGRRRGRIGRARLEGLERGEGPHRRDGARRLKERPRLGDRTALRATRGIVRDPPGIALVDRARWRPRCGARGGIRRGVAREETVEDRRGHGGHQGQRERRAHPCSAVAREPETARPRQHGRNLSERARRRQGSRSAASHRVVSAGAALRACGSPASGSPSCAPWRSGSLRGRGRCP
jgi:hypothetical protein